MDRSLASSLLLIGQVAVAAGCLWLLALSPPADGAMLLLPLWGADEGDAVTLAIAAGALPLARGPLPGSLVVTGRSSAFAGIAQGGTMIVLAAPRSLCGYDATGRIT